jgi:NADPH-dependent 2,4-dienoyl-CoA reductase/sulfur reductase-like enzyme
MRSVERTVIVGGGQAGRRTAEILRSLDADREIVIVSAENEWPYDRPPLSKEVLFGDDHPKGLVQRDAAFFVSQRIDVRLGRRCTRIDVGRSRVDLDDGDALSYGSLVIATGARPRALPLPVQDTRIVTLRTLAEARNLRAQLRSGARLAILGAGLIGLEVAAAAVKQGCVVRVIESSHRILARCMPACIGSRIHAWHRDAGVEFLLGRELRVVTPQPDCLKIVTDRDELEVDCLLVAIGAVPNDEIARDAGIDAEHGILVDASGRTSAPHVFAAGEVARIRETRKLCKRQETWQFAQYQPAAVAHALVGGERPFAEIPWYWTDQYQNNVQVFGEPDEGLVWLERLENGRVSALGLDDDGRVRAAALVNNGREATPVRRLIAGNGRFTHSQLLDLSIPLKRLSAESADVV